jgi:hypothetical protein
MLYRTFTDIDLNELVQIIKSVEARSKIAQIDPQSFLCTYEGHTIFSIFFDTIAVYEQIITQLQEMEFPEEEDFNGTDVENGYLRRLYRTLYLPTGDLLHSKVNRTKVLAME